MKKSTIRGALALCLVMAMIALGACSSAGKYAKWKEAESFQGVELSKYVTLGEYKGMEIMVLPEEVMEKEVLQFVKEQMCIEVERTVVETGDLVVFDYEGTGAEIPEEYLPGMKAEGARLIIGDGGFIPGFEAQIAGQSIGKAFDVNVTFPEDYNPELAGKDATFHCTVHELYFPDMTDERVLEITKGQIESLEVFHSEARVYLIQRIEQENLKQGGSAAMEAAFENAKVTEVPKDELEMYQEMIKAEAAAEKQELKEYLTEVGLDPENWVSQMEDQLRWEMFVFAVAQKEDLTATEEEMNAYLEGQLSPEDPSVTAETILEQVGGKNMLMRGLTQNNVTYFIYENAKKTVQTAETEEDAHTADDGHVH